MTLIMPVEVYADYSELFNRVGLSINPTEVYENQPTPTRLLDGDHAYVLFQNLLKNGSADNMWDLHPPFQIDGNFGGTAGISELFLQRHNGMLHLLPALPSNWTDGKITGLRARGNFEVDVIFQGGKLDYVRVKSNAGEDCDVYYDGKRKVFGTVPGGEYLLRYDPINDALEVDDLSSVDDIYVNEADCVEIRQTGDNGRIAIDVKGASRGRMSVDVYNLNGQKVKSIDFDKTSDTVTVTVGLNTQRVCIL